MMAVIKNILVLTLILIVNFSKAQSEECNFLNSVFEKNNKTFVLNKFLSIENKSNLKDFNESFFKENWTFIENNETPSIQLFLENFDFKKIESELINSKDTFINCTKLNLIGEYSKNSNCKRVFYSISKPIFNKSLDWCLFLKTCFVPATNFYCGGNIEIYRKVNNKWIFYHNISAWTN